MDFARHVAAFCAAVLAATCVVVGPCLVVARTQTPLDDTRTAEPQTPTRPESHEPPQQPQWHPQSTTRPLVAEEDDAGLDTAVTTHYRVVSSSPALTAEHAAAWLEQAYPQFLDALGQDEVGHPPLRVRVHATRDELRRATDVHPRARRL